MKGAFSFGKYIAIPTDKEPSLHKLWYTLEALGEMEISTIHHKSSILPPKIYSVKHTDENGKIRHGQHDDLYYALWDIHRRIILARAQGEKHEQCT